MGCDAYASDLNPIASLLTWGAFNIVGATASRFAAIEAAKARLASAVEAEINRLAIEQDTAGNRAKAYLYCLETRCPRTGWAVPMAPSWVISRTRNTVARLIPNAHDQRYEIEIHSGVSGQDMANAERGTVVGDRLVHIMNTERSGIDIKTIRGDHRDANGVSRNRLRPWDRADFVPRPGDIFQERLYCVQWITRETLERGRQETFFASVTDEDVARERRVEAIVRENLAEWQAQGLVPDMPIEPGDKTDEPIRTRGWTHWHHLFGPRHLLLAKTVRELANSEPDAEVQTALLFALNYILDKSGRLAHWRIGSPGRPGRAPSADAVENVFYNQAFNTFYNFGARALPSLDFRKSLKTKNYLIKTKTKIEAKLAVECDAESDIFVTDPPYADSVNYQEITEYFIAWLHNRPPAPIATWTWDSRRNLAIQGADEKFRRDMVAAYAAIAKCMPANGLQVVMFTHQDAGVWADLGAIVWAAGFSVTAAWNVATEIGKPSGKGNYVQGTINLVLRKRQRDGNARRMEIEAEIETAVAEQLARLNALDDAWHERGGAETLYTDGDLTLAAYAAALQVVTAYSSIDRQPLDRDLYRKLAKKEQTMLRELIDYAASVANTLLVPAGFPRALWRDLAAPERFYVRMLDMEAQGSAKVADFQNFARSFAFAGYADLMASTAANAAALAGAADLKGRLLDSDGFAASVLRKVLLGVWKTMESSTPQPRRGLDLLKSEYHADYWQRRQTLIALADYVALKTARTRPTESAAAQELAEALRNDRV
jgi:putative DNA methylase